MNEKQILEILKSHVNNRDFRNQDNCFLPRLTLNNGKSLSIQASKYHYSEPRENSSEYDEVEIGYPDFNFTSRFVLKFAEDKENPQDTVYPYVPLGELANELYDLFYVGA